jgi:hypothetical protein
MFKYAKKGLTPSQIGVVLRDSFGIPQVKAVTGSKILRILKVHRTRSTNSQQRTSKQPAQAVCSRAGVFHHSGGLRHA